MESIRGLGFEKASWIRSGVLDSVRGLGLDKGHGVTIEAAEAEAAAETELGKYVMLSTIELLAKVLLWTILFEIRESSIVTACPLTGRST